MDTPLAERMLKAFMTQMIRAEAIDEADVVEMADAMREAGDDEGADAFMNIILQANTPTQSEWEADRARARFRAIDGGKSED